MKINWGVLLVKKNFRPFAVAQGGILPIFFMGSNPRKDLHYVHRCGFGVVLGAETAPLRSIFADRYRKSEGK